MLRWFFSNENIHYIANTTILIMISSLSNVFLLLNICVKSRSVVSFVHAAALSSFFDAEDLSSGFVDNDDKSLVADHVLLLLLVDGWLWMLTLICGMRGEGRGFGIAGSGIWTDTAEGTGECFLLLSCCQQGLAWSLLNLSLRAFKAICL